MKINMHTSLGTVKQEEKSAIMVCIMVYNIEKDVASFLVPAVKSILGLFQKCSCYIKTKSMETRTVLLMSKQKITPSFSLAFMPRNAGNLVTGPKMAFSPPCLTLPRLFFSTLSVWQERKRRRESLAGH